MSNTSQSEDINEAIRIQTAALPGIKGIPIINFFDGMALSKIQSNAKERFKTIRDMQTRSDDILLVAYLKSGTHWVWEIISMLVRGKADYVKDIKENVFLEAKPSLKILEDVASPRVLNTHLPFRWLPRKHKETDGKIVHVVRNPKDVSVSFFHHYNSRFEDPLTMGITWNDYFQYIMNAPFQHYGGWFNYEKEFEEAERNDESLSIYTMYYEDLKQDPEVEIKRLAQYLEIDVTDQFVMEICEKTSFTKLREADKHELDLKKDLTKENLKLPIIYRKGEIGDWKNHFTVAQNEEFDAYYSKIMKDSEMRIKFE